MKSALVFCVALLAATASAAIFSASDFDHHLNFGSGMDLYWTYDSEMDKVSFGMSTAATGWVAFGLSPNGGMVGADVFAAALNGEGTPVYGDYHASAHSPPELDATQDWTFEEMEVEGGVTQVKFSRSVSTCDTANDLSMEGTVRAVMAAHSTGWDISDGANQHDMLAVLSVNLLTRQSGVSIPDSAMEFGAVLSNANVTAGKDTTYMCRGLKLPNATYDMVAFGPSHEFDSTVHHVVVYACETPADEAAFLTQGDCSDGVFTTNFDILKCAGSGQPIAGWAVGGGNTVFPSDVGLPIGAGAIEYVVVEVHYDTPDLQAIENGNDGVTLYLEAPTRAKKAGVFWLGHDASTFVLPPGHEAFVLEGRTPAACTEAALSEDINIFGYLMHAHLQGRAIEFTHSRDGVELVTISNPHYDFAFQEYETLEEPIVVKPGDDLRVRCTYDTTGKFREAYYAGESTGEEMCLVAVLYYSMQPVTSMVQAAPNQLIIPHFAASLVELGLSATAVNNARDTFLLAIANPMTVMSEALHTFFTDAGVVWTEEETDLWLEAVAAYEGMSMCYNNADYLLPFSGPHPMAAYEITQPLPIVDPCMVEIENSTSSGAAAVVWEEKEDGANPTVMVIVAVGLFFASAVIFLVLILYFTRPPKDLETAESLAERRRSEYMERVSSRGQTSSFKA